MIFHTAKLPALFWMASLIVLVGCQQSHVKMKIDWKGATAEDLEEYVEMHYPQMELAVIDDMQGTVYFQMPLVEVEQLVANQKSVTRDDMKTQCQEIDGPIPPLPNVTMKESLHFQLKPDAGAKYSLTPIDIMEAIQPIPEDELPAAWKKVVVSDGKGGLVPLADVVDVTSLPSPRPLIIDKRK